jgi:hypothetical protein
MLDSESFAGAALDFAAALEGDHPIPCDRCGSFAQLRNHWEERWCDACWVRRTAEVGAASTAGGLLDDTFGLLMRVAPRLIPLLVLLALPFAVAEGVTTLPLWWMLFGIALPLPHALAAVLYFRLADPAAPRHIRLRRPPPRVLRPA